MALVDAQDNRRWRLLTIIPAALTLLWLLLLGPVADDGPLVLRHDWVPALGVSLSLYLDGLSLLFALLVSGIGTFVILYAVDYMSGHPRIGRFLLFLLLFMLSMLGLVLAGNLLTLYICWELTSLTSYLLIGFEHQREESRQGALQALLVTAAGGLALLVGLLMIGSIAEGMELSELLASEDLLRSHDLYLPILLLILAGAFTKSAQVPFHFWLPGAMEAPTPVSAYLHSATMVKAGIYLLARLHPVLGGTEYWTMILCVTGGLTLLVGSVLALGQRDLKRILAYTTISALGLLVLLLGIGTDAAIQAAVVFLVVHSLYKGALFLVAGAVDHAAGTRDIYQLGGLRSRMPWIAFAAVLALLSMAGLPPMLGFIGKELAYGAALGAEQWGMILIAALVAANALTIVAGGMVGVAPFFGTPSETPLKPHDPTPAMLSGPMILALSGLLIGIYSPPIIEQGFASAASAVAARPMQIDLGLWHGWNVVIMLSGLTLILGGVIYPARNVLIRSGGWLAGVAPYGPGRGYRAAIDSLVWIADVQTRLLQSGYLRGYIAIILLVMVVLAGGTLLQSISVISLDAFGDVLWHEAAIVVVMMMATLAAVLAQSRLYAIVALGIVGYCVAILFLLMGAPDLAMTQFAIETLTVILFILVLYKLPRFARLSSTLQRGRDLLIASVAGSFVTLLVLAATATPFSSQLAPFFASESLPQGKGRNVVNVILVDFRALDTLGEITVLAVAAIGVQALLKLKSRKEEE